MVDDVDFLLALADELHQSETVQVLLEPQDAATAATSGPALTGTTAKPVLSKPSNAFLGLVKKSDQEDVGTGQDRSPLAPVHYAEKCSGIKMKNPVCSGTVLKERFAELCFVKLAQVRPSMGEEGPWATIGVISEKHAAQTSKGQPYSRWRISDLNDGEMTVFLWSSAHQEHWKETEGTVICLYNAVIRSEGSSGPSLSISEPQQLQKIGTSVGFARCGGTRKDGTRCTRAVDKTVCQYCIYHVQAAMKKFGSRRPELGGSHLWRQQRVAVANAGKAESPDAKEKATPGAQATQKLQQMQQHYGLAPRDLSRLTPGAPGVKDLSSSLRALGPHNSLQGCSAPHNVQPGSTPSAGVQEAFVELSDDENWEAPSGLGGASGTSAPGSEELSAAKAKLLARIREIGGLPVADPNRTRPSTPPQQRPAQKHQQYTSGTGPRTQAGTFSHTAGSQADAIPRVGPALPKQPTELPGGGRPSSSRKGPLTAKEKMLKSIGLGRGCVNKAPPSAPCTTSKRGRGQGGNTTGNATAGTSRDAPPAVLPSRPVGAGAAAFAAAFGSIAGEVSLEACESKYQCLVDEEEDQRLQKVLTALEKKDEVVMKMESITKMEVTAFRCHECGVVLEKRHSNCVGHNVVRVKTTKRWWTCDDCGWKTTTLGVVYPNKHCPKCQNPAKLFRPSAMYTASQKAPPPEMTSVASKDTLLPRGTEHAFSLKS